MRATSVFLCHSLAILCCQYQFMATSVALWRPGLVWVIPMSLTYTGPFHHCHDSNSMPYLQGGYSRNGRDTHRPVARRLARDPAGCTICPRATGQSRPKAKMPGCQLSQVGLGQGERPQHSGSCPAGAWGQTRILFLMYLFCVYGYFACLYIWVLSCAWFLWS